MVFRRLHAAFVLSCAAWQFKQFECEHTKRRLWLSLSQLPCFPCALKLLEKPPSYAGYLCTNSFYLVFRSIVVVAVLLELDFGFFDSIRLNFFKFNSLYSRISETFFCVPNIKFVSATNVARAGKRGNICVGNNVSATMCPRLQGP